MKSSIHCSGYAGWGGGGGGDDPGVCGGSGHGDHGDGGRGTGVCGHGSHAGGGGPWERGGVVGGVAGLPYASAESQSCTARLSHIAHWSSSLLAMAVATTSSLVMSV